MFAGTLSLWQNKPARPMPSRLLAYSGQSWKNLANSLCMTAKPWYNAGNGAKRRPLEPSFCAEHVMDMLEFELQQRNEVEKALRNRIRDLELEIANLKGQIAVKNWQAMKADKIQSAKP